MCKFLSAIITQDGRILSMPEATDSHEDLIAHFKLHERTGAAAHGQKFIRVEFTPKDGKSYDQPETYELRVDEESTPAWFDADRRAVAVSELRRMIEGMILRDGVTQILIGACAIVSGTATVVKMVSGRIAAVLSGGTVQHVLSGGTVQSVWSGGTVQHVLSGGTVRRVLSGGTVRRVESGGTVQSVESGGTVQHVLSGGTVQHVLSGGTVRRVESGGTVQHVLSGGTVRRDDNEKGGAA